MMWVLQTPPVRGDLVSTKFQITFKSKKEWEGTEGRNRLTSFAEWNGLSTSQSSSARSNGMPKSIRTSGGGEVTRFICLLAAQAGCTECWCWMFPSFSASVAMYMWLHAHWHNDGNALLIEYINLQLRRLYSAFCRTRQVWELTGTKTSYYTNDVKFTTSINPEIRSRTNYIKPLNYGLILNILPFM